MKIAMFAPYFGPDKNQSFSNYFEYWQKSAAANREIDFFIPTNLDFSRYRKYDNIHFIEMSAEVFWEKIQSILDFPISHDYYKTGEYRIFFGIIFSDIIQGYDYWGITEFDMIYGDILKFVGEYLERGVNVVGKTAPFRLIKNTYEMNHMPFWDLKEFEHPLTLEVAFSTDYTWYFSEIRGMNVRYYQAGIEIASIDHCFGDITSKYPNLTCYGMSGVWGFNWQDGHLYGYNDQSEKREFLAIHIQKRKMQVLSESPADKFCIVPDRIINDEINVPSIRKKPSLYTLKHYIKSYVNIYCTNRQLLPEAKYITLELLDYCNDHGLMRKKRPGIINQLIYNVRRKILWI